MPDVPYRAAVHQPAPGHLAEDDGAATYQVWPYEVAYDSASGRWYADIAPRPGITQEGTYPPPPGYFIRLALCRFQPYSIPPGPEVGQAVEVSPVVLATFAQPVPDRSVSVVADTSDKTGLTMLVSVTGPAYQGWRPPDRLGVGRRPCSTTPTISYAPSNPQLYGRRHRRHRRHVQSTSTMVVEVQIQNEVYNKLGLEGDLAWETTSQGPVLLPPTFSGEVFVTWGDAGAGPDAGGVVDLPDRGHLIGQDAPADQRDRLLRQRRSGRGGHQLSTSLRLADPAQLTGRHRPVVPGPAAGDAAYSPCSAGIRPALTARTMAS